MNPFYATGNNLIATHATQDRTGADLTGIAEEAESGSQVSPGKIMSPEHISK